MQSAHLSPGIEILTSLNFESQLQIVFSHLTYCPQIYPVTMIAKNLKFLRYKKHPVGLSNEQASGVGSVEQRSECRTLSIRGLGKAKACPPSPLL